MTGPAPYLTGQTKKRRQQKEIERLTLDFELNGGKVTELPTERMESKYKPAWTQYQAVAFEDADGEDRA